MELKQKVRKGASWLMLSNFLTVGSQLFCVPILARLLKPGDFGSQANGMLLMDLTVIFTYPFINKSIILRKELTDDFLRSATSLSFILTSLIGVFFFFTAPLFAIFLHDPHVTFILRAISFVFLIKGLYQPYQSLFEKELRFKEISNINLLAYWVGYFIVPITLAYLGFGYKSLVFGLISSEVVYMVFYLSKSRIVIGAVKKDLAKEILMDSRNLIVQNLGNTLATNGDYLIISKFLGPVSLGYYSQAYKIMKMPTNIIGNLINSLSFASFSKINEDNEKLSRAFTYSSFILALFSFPIFFITMVFSKEIVLILLGQKWMATVPVLQILAFGIFLRMSYKIPGTILKAKQRFALTARVQVIYAINIIVFSLCLMHFSIEGVAIGTLVALMVQYGQLTYYVNKELGTQPLQFYKILAKPLLFSLAIFAACVLLKFVASLLLPGRDVLNFGLVMAVVLPAAAVSVLLKGKRFFGEPYTWWLEFVLNKKKEPKKKGKLKVEEKSAVAEPI